MKTLLITAVLLIASVGCRAIDLTADSKTNQPNIVFIFADDLGYNNLSCYGAPKIKTPVIDQMAKEGIRFTDFYAASSVCTPSRYALLTGRYPHRAKDKAMLRWIEPPREKGGISAYEITVAQRLQELGYATACIGKWHLGDSEKYFPTNFGFDYWWGLANNPYRKAYKNGVPIYENTKIAVQPADLNNLTKSYTEKTVDFIEKSVKQGKPFFVYLPHTYPHTPWATSKEFERKSAGGRFGDTIEEIDWSTGEILKKLKELGVDSNTMVVFTSDNGATKATLRPPNLSNHPLKRGKASVYEGGIRVPCVVRWPGRIKENQVVKNPAIMLDWFPTFMAMTGGKMPDDRPHDGRDISGLLFGSGERSDSEFYANFIAGWYRDTTRKFGIMQHRSGKWKYVALNDGELYNLEKDVSEENNVKTANMEVYNRLKKEFDFFTKSIGKAPAAGDIDGDGMPDNYEKANNLDPLYAIDSYLDPDGNGKTAYQEYLEKQAKK